MQKTRDRPRETSHLAEVYSPCSESKENKISGNIISHLSHGGLHSAITVQC